MTVALVAMHDPSDDERWKSTQWNEVEKVVARLQHRIAVATSEGNWRDVRNLQRLLVKSFAARLKAVKRVAQDNQGKNTPGVDGVRWTTPAQRYQAALSLTDRKRKAQPLKRVFIPKASGKLRPLGIPCMWDRANQALWDLALLPVAEELSDNNSYGFRPFKGAWDAYAQIHTLFSRKKYAADWILDADIKGFFDNLSHDWLLENIPMDKRTLRSWLKAGVLEDGKFQRTDEGTPQGGVISPTLANIALTGMEGFLAKRFKRGHTGRGNAKVNILTRINLVRYADDFIVTGRSRRQLERVKLALTEFLSERGLEFSEEKTGIRSLDEGFDFLGWNFRKLNNTFLGRISRKSIRSHLDNLKAIIKGNGNAPVGVMIFKLNQSITGWVNYHRCASCIWEVWGYCDHWLFKQLWLWARKRHRSKGAKWIKRRYWKTIGRNSWTFNTDGVYLRHHDARKRIIFRLPADIKVFRLENRERIQQLWKRKQEVLLMGDRLKLWRIQKGLCAVCNKLIYDPQNKSRIDHLVPTTAGGTSAFSNLRLRHNHCAQHKQAT